MIRNWILVVEYHLKQSPVPVQMKTVQQYAVQSRRSHIEIHNSRSKRKPIGVAFSFANALVMLRNVDPFNQPRDVDWYNIEYADMLSDALFGICRICGNFPSWTTSLEQCCPVVSPKALLESKVDPFGVLPMKSSPRVNSLMYHCKYSEYHSSYTNCVIVVILINSRG